jgi:hypothetical protein
MIIFLYDSIQYLDSQLILQKMIQIICSAFFGRFLIVDRALAYFARTNYFLDSLHISI